MILKRPKNICCIGYAGEFLLVGIVVTYLVRLGRQYEAELEAGSLERFLGDLFGKFRNKPMPMEEYDDLVMAAEMFKNAEEKYLMFFSKSGFTESVKERAARENAVLLTIEDLY